MHCDSFDDFLGETRAAFISASCVSWLSVVFIIKTLNYHYGDDCALVLESDLSANGKVKPYFQKSFHAV